MFSRRKTLKLSELSILVQQFAILVDAGISMTECLNLLWRQSRNDRVKQFLIGAKSKIEQGKRLEEAFYTKELFFPEYCLSLLSVGELTGNLKQVFDELAEFTNEKQKYIRLLINASIYPVILVIVAILSIGFMLIKVLPSFFASFQVPQTELPRITRFLLNLSTYLHSNFEAVVFLAGFLLTGVFVLFYDQRFKRYCRRMVYKLPYLGGWLWKAELVALLKHLTLLTVSGIDLITALEKVKSGCSNDHMAALVDTVSKKVQSGSALHQAFAGFKSIPVFVTEMIRLGEESSRLPRLLEKITNYYDLELSYRLNLFGQFIEPFVIVVLGIIIGGMIIAIYLPLFQMVNKIPI